MNANFSVVIHALQQQAENSSVNSPVIPPECIGCIQRVTVAPGDLPWRALLCQVMHRIIGNGRVYSSISTLKQKLNVMKRLEATRGCPPFPTAQHCTTCAW